MGSDQSCEETEGPEEDRPPRTGVGVVSPLPNGIESVLKALSSVYMGRCFPSCLRSFSFPLELPEARSMRSLTELSEVFLETDLAELVGSS